jgi:hypothetical protein
VRPSAAPADAPAAPPPWRAPELWALLAAGLALRLPGLLRFDLWQDEIYSILEAQYLLDSPIGPGGIELRALYFLLLHPLAEADPHATVLLRLPSLAFGLLGIALTWWLAARHLGRGAAFVAAAVVCVMPMHVNASQIIRWIAFIYVVGTLLSAGLLRALETDATRDHLLVLAMLLVGSFTHVTFLMPAFGLTLGAHLVRHDGRLGLQWPSRRAWVATWLPFLGVLAAYYALLWLVVPHERLMGAPTGGAAGLLLPAAAYHLTPALLVVAGAGGMWLLGRGDVAPRRIAMMALAGLSVPTAVLVVGGMRGSVPVSVIYLSGSLAMLALCAGAVVPALGRACAGTAWVPAGVAAVLAAGFAPSLVSQLADGSRFEFRGPLARAVAADSTAPVVLYPVIHARWDHPGVRAIEFTPAATVATLDSLRAAHPRFWFIAAERRHGMLGDSDGAKRRWLERHCEPAGRWRRPRFDYERYDTALFRCDAAGAAAP